MRPSMFRAEGIGEYHDNLLLVQVGARSAQSASSLDHAVEVFSSRPPGAKELISNFAGISGEFLDFQGMSALNNLSGSGRIKKIIPLSGEVEENATSRMFRKLPGTGLASLLGSYALSPSRDKATVGDSISRGTSFVETKTPEDADILQKQFTEDPNIISVSRVPVRYLMAERSGARAAPPAGGASAMWNLEKIGWQRLRDQGASLDASNVKIAVLDTGIDQDHPDLIGHVAKNEWFNHLSGIVTSSEDIIGHGTHVSGTIAADMNNGTGTAGVCDGQINSWKIFSDMAQYGGPLYGYEYYVDPVMYLRALIDCLDEDMDVVNLSIGGAGGPSPQELQAFNALTAADVAVVAAMGNERAEGSPTSYPAAIDDVIAVGATQISDRVTNFSNRGSHICLCAPGSAIWSTLPIYPGNSGFDANYDGNGNPYQGKPYYRETDYDAWNGTSMATPHVAGACALYMAKHRNLHGTSMRPPLAKLRDELEDSCDKVAGMRGRTHHVDYGYGRLNLENLLQ